MKKEFTITELGFVQEKVSQMLSVLPKHTADPQLLRTVCKLKQKFAYNARYVYVSQKEKALLLNMIDFRLNEAHAGNPVHGQEYFLLKGLRDKLEPPNKEGT